MNEAGPPPEQPVASPAGGEIPAAAEAAQPLDPLTAATLTALDQAPPQRTWIKSLILLAVSLGFFAMAGLFNNSPTGLAILVGVLLFHELGHYAGMRWFNYRDVRMFFIPLFGAAVAGRRTSVEGYQEAIVLLLGPLPGILLGGVLGVICMFYDSEMLRSATVTLLAINGFNLLPFMPLDGGRLLHLVLFSRQRHLEALFQFVTGVLLAICGGLLGGWLLAILGVFMAFGCFFTFKMSTLARELRSALALTGDTDFAAPIPRELAVPLIERVQRAFPQVKQPQSLANVVRQLWERIHIRPPGMLASLGILALHGGAFLSLPAMVVIFNRPLPREATTTRVDGKVVRTREVRVWGRLRSSTELDDRGRPHGRHLEYSPVTGKLLAEGNFLDGQREGIWMEYDAKGQPASMILYRRGVAIQVKQP